MNKTDKKSLLLNLMKSLLNEENTYMKNLDVEIVMGQMVPVGQLLTLKKEVELVLHGLHQL